MNINAYNIKLRKSYSSSENSSNELKKSAQNIYYSPYDDVNVSDITLPHTTTPLLFTNDRMLKDSYIVTSDKNKQTKLNDTVVEDKLAALLPIRDNIWKPTWGRIKNYGT